MLCSNTATLPLQSRQPSTLIQNIATLSLDSYFTLAQSVFHTVARVILKCKSDVSLPVQSLPVFRKETQSLPQLTRSVIQPLTLILLCVLFSLSCAQTVTDTSALLSLCKEKVLYALFSFCLKLSFTDVCIACFVTFKPVLRYHLTETYLPSLPCPNIMCLLQSFTYPTWYFP